MADLGSSILPSTVIGVVLAGGRSLRMGGGDKALLGLAGRPLLAHVIGRLGSQVRRLVLNANGDPARFSQFGLPVIADVIDGFVGPLGGVLTGMRWVRENSDCGWIVTVPSDTPFIPTNLVQRLIRELEPGVEITVARSRNSLHPTVALWPVALFDALGDWLRSDQRAIHAWLETRRWKAVDFEDHGGSDPFFNVNTPEDLAAAECHLKAPV